MSHLAQPCAMVFAHPGHEVIVAGMMQRYRPHLLFLTRADSAGDLEREALTRHGLARLDLVERTTFFDISEHDIYRWLLAGDAVPLIVLRDRIATWLARVRPATLYGDAFELSNVVHDIGRAALDSAWRDYVRHVRCENFELPLACRVEPDLWDIRLQQFPFGPFETVHLTAAEVQVKQEIADWIVVQRAEAAAVEKLFCIEREVFRRVPVDRDYTQPPDGLKRHYDEWGQFQVTLGKYKEAIRFADHFVPIVRQMPLIDQRAPLTQAQ